MNTPVTSIEIFNNTLGGQYYILEGQRFDINFPIKWAIENLIGNEKVGPFHCDNCAIYGLLNGVFIGYCSNCAVDKYNYSRGNGFNAVGVEQIVDHLGEELNPQNSIWNTYMENVNIEQIGLQIINVEDEEYEEEEEDEEEEEIEEEDYDW
jgi:hypothetical protein